MPDYVLLTTDEETLLVLSTSETDGLIGGQRHFLGFCKIRSVRENMHLEKRAEEFFCSMDL